MSDFITTHALGIFSLVLLAFFFPQCGYSYSSHKHKQMWIASVIAAFIVQLLDIITCELIGRPGTTGRVLFYTLNSLLFILTPIFSAFLGSFIQCSTDCSDKNLQVLKRTFTMVIGLNAILTVVNIPTGLYFKMNEYNEYIRGSLLGLSGFFAIFPMLVVLCRILVFYKDSNYRLKCILFSGILIPSIFANLHIQGIITIPMLYPSVSIIMLFLSLLLTQNSVCGDHLTGLRNKKGIEKYFSDVNQKACLGVIYIDIDHFKDINDKFGHTEGDAALCAVSKIILSATRRCDLVARIGGDEFLVVSELSHEDEVDLIINRIKTELNKYHKTAGKSYTICISCGNSIKLKGVKVDKEKLIAQADQNMYLVKRRCAV